MTRPRETETSRPQVFEKNPLIDLNTVNANEKLQQQLNKLGVEVRPEYRIEPPLGSFRSDWQIPRS